MLPIQDSTQLTRRTPFHTGGKHISVTRRRAPAPRTRTITLPHDRDPHVACPGRAAHETRHTHPDVDSVPPFERGLCMRITATRHTTRVHAPSCTAHPLTPARFSTTPVAAPGALAAHATGPRVLAASHTPSPHPSRVGQTRRKPGTLQPPSGPTQTHARQAGPSLIAFPPTTHASPPTHASP